ncbi:hypothetical protein DFP72DRAFT_1124556 [Ephemerocybe angulata]|uniref:Uncharacterized protein n=1 Tax=Ephemerocybe angulata TaxID=980116 RepID=A0A8H6HZT9_9AGAR|nr:hypothetical protein DFP72DRAFT_1124556 [Tulosesus angulatus]
MVDGWDGCHEWSNHLWFTHWLRGLLGIIFPQIDIPKRVSNPLLGYNLYEDLKLQVGDESGSLSVHAPDLSAASFEKLIPVVNVFLHSCLGDFDKSLLLRPQETPKDIDDIDWDGLKDFLRVVSSKPWATPVFFQITPSLGIERETLELMKEKIREMERRGAERLVDVFNDPALDEATFRGGKFLTHAIASEKPQWGGRRRWFVLEEVTDPKSGRWRWCKPGKWTDEIYINDESLMEERRREVDYDNYYAYYCSKDN